MVDTATAETTVKEMAANSYHSVRKTLQILHKQDEICVITVAIHSSSLLPMAIFRK